MFVDTHCHLDFPEFDNDRKYVIEQALKEDIGFILNPGIDLESSKRAIQIAKNFKIVYAACGIHPHNARSVNNDAFNGCMDLLSEDKVIAIGETGLDFFYQNSDIKQQIILFRKHINFARENNIPLIVHQRNAEEAVIEIFNEIKFPSKVVFHCFVSNKIFLDWIIKNNFYISFTGILTFKSALSLKKLIENVPIERVFFETDSPYLAPHPVRGKRNEPCFVRFIVEEFARLKRMSVSEVSEITTNNALQFFGIL